MKVVDFHVHIGEADNWHPWVHEYQRHQSMELYEPGRFEEIMNPEGLPQYLKGQGVDVAVVLAEHSPITTGVITNEYVADFCNDVDNLIPFASINKNAQARPGRELRRCVEELGFKGLKLYPPYHLHYANDPEVYPMYAVAEELEIPLMVHTGTSLFRGSRLKYADPIFLDDVAVDFPDLTIIQVHSGRGLFYERALFLARIHKNVYLEIAGLPPQRLLEYFPIRDLEKISDKILFGSDWPGLPSIKKNIEIIQDLPIRGELKRKILGENAIKLLGL